MPRAEFDHLLIQRAQKAGARVHERTEAVTPMFETGWVTGARVRPSDDRDAEPTEIRARFTIAADGAASRIREARGVRRDDSRPLGIAARRYYRTPYHPGPWFESWLDLWEGDLLLPGYGGCFRSREAGSTWGRPAEHVQGLQADLRPAAVRRVLDDAARRVGDLGGDGRGRVLSGPLPMSLNACPRWCRACS